MVRKSYNFKIKQTDKNSRIRVLSVVFLITALLFFGRLFVLQILRGGFYAALAADQHELFEKIFPERGTIYVAEKNGDQQVLYPLVANRRMYVVFAVPKEIEDATTTAERLLSVLGLPDDDERSYAEVFSLGSSTVSSTIIRSERDQQKFDLLSKWIANFNKKDKYYYPLRERIDDETIKKIEGLGLKGVDWVNRSYRFYPEKGVGGQIFGFWGYDGDERRGKYGLEGYYDNLLAGQMGEIKSERDAFGNIIALGNNQFKEKIDGSDLILTINRAIQFKACESLKKSIDKHGAKGGSIIVMEPSTGAILAMCSFPDFDPDKYYEVKDASLFNNKAIFDAYEPGSIFKPITMAGAIDSGRISSETYYTDTGVVDYGQDQIRNFENKSYGYVNMTRVLEYSINTGVIFAMRQMGSDNFIDYVKKFGFGEMTGIELQKEMPGNISNLKIKGEIHKATATFGQGITATPLQMITAFSAVINGGKLMKPYIVSQVIDDDKAVKTSKPQVIRQVISAKTSLTLKAMLVSVVENGHAKGAQVPGYRIGGKTGTAQVPDKRGGYKSDDSIIGSFMGFAPYNNPKLAIFVRVDEPQSNRTGEGVAAPVFVEVANFALQYYNIPHDK